MSTVIIEHVKVGDLPDAWRERLAKPSDARVTVRIDEETTRREGEASQLNEGVETLPSASGATATTWRT